jgi:hypothetical protein
MLMYLYCIIDIWKAMNDGCHQLIVYVSITMDLKVLIVILRYVPLISLMFCYLLDVMMIGITIIVVALIILANIIH